MCTLTIEDLARDLLAQYGTDDLTEIETILVFWREEATRDLALSMADMNRERARAAKKDEAA